MISSQDTTTLLIPARRRAVVAVPVLIQIPNLGGTRAPRRPARRRRLRREVRVAGCLLLALLPISLVISSIGGGRLTRLAASSLTVAAEAEAFAAPEVPAVSLSLSLEPVAPASRDQEAPVFLPGILLPADPIEEDRDGRH